MVLHVCLLGALEVYRRGSRVTLPPGTRLRSLFAWLALYPGLHPRARVAAWFWPDVPDRSARASLRSAVWALHRSLGPAAECLAADRAAVGLRADCLVVDVHEFSRLAEAGRYADAMALCRGDLLPDLDDDWVADAREAHAERLALVLGGMAKQAGAAGDASTAAAWARRRADLEPLDEQAARDLIRWLADAGDAAAALIAYRRLSARLQAELGVPPAPQTRQLATRIRASRVRAVPGTAAAVDERPRIK